MSIPPKWLALSNPCADGDAMFDLFRQAVRGNAPPAALLIPETYQWPSSLTTAPSLTKGGPETLYGIQVIRSAVLPKMPAVAIDPHFRWISDEGRQRINARFLELFGEKEVAFALTKEQLRALLNDWNRRIDEDITSAFSARWA